MQSMSPDITDALKKVKTLTDDLEMLLSLDTAQFPEGYSEASQKIAIDSEQITKKLRALVFNITYMPAHDYMLAAADNLGIKITNETPLGVQQSCSSNGRDNALPGIITIKIPAMLPKKMHSTSRLITEPLYAALKDFTNHNTCLPRYGCCLICVVHVYRKDLAIKNRVRDYDNLELKPVIDVINLFLLTDDTGILCDHFYSTKLGSEDATIFTIMDKQHFNEWFLQHIDADFLDI